MTDDDELLAAEFALGLLDEAEAQVLRARARVDAMMALRISWWRDQLAPLAGEAVTPAPDGVWRKIEAQLPDNDNANTARPWKWATGGMGLIAAALLAVIALRPAPVAQFSPVSSQPLVASLVGEGGTAVTISVDDNAGVMFVTPVALKAGAGDAELWVIPAGKTKPISMGVIDDHTVTMRHIGEKTNLLAPGATFAISLEAKGGSPTGEAQGPIVASGKIIRT